MTPRRRTPTRGSRRRPSPAAVIGLLLLLALVAVPAASMTQAVLGRSAASDVVDDPSGAVGLDVADAVTKNSVDPLVNVTNNFGVDLSVTVTLQDGSDGDLYLDGTNVGDQVTFTVVSGDTRTVDIEAANSAGPQIYFDVSASSSGIDFEAANRHTDVNGGNSGGGDCPPNNPNC